MSLAESIGSRAYQRNLEIRAVSCPERHLCARTVRCRT